MNNGVMGQGPGGMYMVAVSHRFTGSLGSCLRLSIFWIISWLVTCCTMAFFADVRQTFNKKVF